MNIKGTTFGTSITANASSVGMTSGVLFATMVIIDSTATLTGITVQYGSAAPSYTGNNCNGVGLFTIDPSTGTYTLVASSTNSATIWGTSAYVTKSIPFSSTYVATKGVYIVALLYNVSATTTAPAFLQGTQMGSSIIGTGFANNMSITGNVAGITAMPSSITASTLTKLNQVIFITLY